MTLCKLVHVKQVIRLLMIALLPSCQEAAELRCKSHTKFGCSLHSFKTHAAQAQQAQLRTYCSNQVSPTKLVLY